MRVVRFPFRSFHSMQASILVQVKSASKVVAAVLKQSPRSRTDFVASKKGLSALVALLKDKDDMTVGNAALGISSCSEVSRFLFLLNYGID